MRRKISSEDRMEVQDISHLIWPTEGRHRGSRSCALFYTRWSLRPVEIFRTTGENDILWSLLTRVLSLEDEGGQTVLHTGLNVSIGLHPWRVMQLNCSLLIILFINGPEMFGVGDDE